MIQMKVKLQRWLVPNYVIAESPITMRQEGFIESMKWPLSDVDEETLSKQCDEFRAGVFAKAGKKDPIIKINL